MRYRCTHEGGLVLEFETAAEATPFASAEGWMVIPDPRQTAAAELEPPKVAPIPAEPVEELPPEPEADEPKAPRRRR